MNSTKTNNRPNFKPFDVIHPVTEHLTDITARSADFKNQDELRAELKNNALSFHHYTKAYLGATGDKKTPEEFIPFSQNFLNGLLEKQYLTATGSKTFFQYLQHNPKTGDDFTCIIGLCDVRDYLNNKIKKHENTQTAKENYLSELMGITQIVGEPVLMSFEDKKNHDLFLKECTNRAPIFSFQSKDGVTHRLFPLTETENEQLDAYLTELNVPFYIADGHHRSASAARSFQKSGDEAFGWFPVCLVPESRLTILPFYRLVNEMGMSTDQLLEKLSRHFRVMPLEHFGIPKEKGHFDMRIGNQNYRLAFKGNYTGDAYKDLDVVILENYVLQEIFNIHDSRSDARLSYIPGNVSLQDALESAKGGGILFSMKAVDFAEVRKIADLDMIMPPKSTYIEPKLRAGMIIHQFGN